MEQGGVWVSGGVWLSYLELVGRQRAVPVDVKPAKQLRTLSLELLFGYVVGVHVGVAYSLREVCCCVAVHRYLGCSRANQCSFLYAAQGISAHT